MAYAYPSAVGREEEMWNMEGHTAQPDSDAEDAEPGDVDGPPPEKAADMSAQGGVL